MKIQCEQCKIEYNIDDAAIGERGIRAQCPRCNHITTIRKSQPALLDQARARLETAICVNCGKPTDPVPGDPIPICPSCQAQSIDIGSKTNVAGAGGAAPRATPARPSQPPQIFSTGIGSGAPGITPPPVYEPPGSGGVAEAGAQQMWRIKKSPTGDIYGPFDRELIAGWIEGEKIVPGDEISRVGGPWRAAGEHEDFAAVFAARHGTPGNGGRAAGAPPAPAATGAPSLERRNTLGGSAISAPRIVTPRVSRPRGPFPWRAVLGAGGVVVVLFAGVGVWYTGALASLRESLRREPPPPPRDQTDNLIDDLRAQYPNVQGTAADHLAAGVAAEAPDTVEAWTAARAEYAQALSLERKNVEALARIAEMNAMLALYDEQTNLRDEALRFGDRAMQWDPDSVVAARARAAALLATGPQNASEARELLEGKVLPKAPDDPIALTMLGRSYAPTNAAKAEDILKKALEKGGSMLRPRVELGRLYGDTHRYQRALETFKPIVDRSFLAAYHTGRIDERMGAYKEAAAAYKLAAKIAEPSGGRPWADAVVSHAVVLYQALGNAKGAAAALAPLEERFLGGAPTEKLRADQASRLKLHLATIARLTGNHARSIEMSRAVIAEKDLTYAPAASFNLGLTALRMGDFAEADRAFDEADVPGLRDRVQSEIYFWHGLTKQRRGESQGAESSFEDARKEDENNWRAVLAHAVLLGESGERDIEALAKMQDLANVDPTFYDQYQRLTLYFPDPSSDLLAAAQTIFTRIHTKTHGTDPRSSTALGFIALFAGNRNKAAGHATAALNEAHPNAAAFVLAGLIAEGRGGKANLDGALDRYTVAKSSSPSAFLSTAIGRVEAGRGNCDKAMNDLQDALNRSPDYVPAHYWLGVCYQKKGEQKQAIGKWADALKYDPDYVRASRAIFETGA